MLVDDEFYLSLPDDPVEAFGLFEAYLTKELGEPNEHDSYVEQEYTQHIAAYCLEYGIDLGTSLDQASDESASDFYYRLRPLAGRMAKQSNLKRLRSLKVGKFGEYVLLPAQKVEIRHYIERIRELIDKTHLTAEKRRELVKRLSAFSAAVELDRTSVQALHSFYVFAKKEAKDAKNEFKNDAEPIFEMIERINSLLAKASEYLGLPRPEETKKLPKTQKKIEGPKRKSTNKYDLDDDIPF